MVETAVALVVLAAAMVALAQLVTLAGRQRRQSEERRIALQEVANQAEQLALLRWEDVAADKLRTWQASPELAAAIPHAACQISVSEEPGSPAGQRIQLRVAWTNAAGQEVEPAELTIWKFATEAQP